DVNSLIEKHSDVNWKFDSILNVLSDSVVYNDLQSQLPGIINKISLMVSELSELRSICTRVEKDLLLIKDLSRTRPNRVNKLLAELEGYWAAALSSKGFKDLIEYWMVLELNDYDRRVIEIEKEPQLIKRAELLDRVLGKFIRQMLEQLPRIQKELEVTLLKLKEL
ncbi:hypothetical protein, partial [Mycobacterium tuberculosis]